MDWLNYHHLLYFWLVAREGSIAKAGERLRLAPSTISGQLGMLVVAWLIYRAQLPKVGRSFEARAETMRSRLAG